jgi:hypothetical protein
VVGQLLQQLGFTTKAALFEVNGLHGAVPVITIAMKRYHC